MNITVRTLQHYHREGCFSPLEFSILYVWQTYGPLLYSNSELFAKMRF